MGKGIFKVPDNVLQKAKNSINDSIKMRIRKGGNIIPKFRKPDAKAVSNMNHEGTLMNELCEWANGDRRMSTDSSTEIMKEEDY